MTEAHEIREDRLDLRSLLRLPPALLVTLLPWWASLVQTVRELLAGHELTAFAWGAGGLLYSAAVAAFVIHRSATRTD